MVTRGVLSQGQTQGSTLQQCTNKTLTTGPFDNTFETNEVSPKVEVGGLQDSSVYNLVGTHICDYTLQQSTLANDMH
jgi:hypothetical protein